MEADPLKVKRIFRNNGAIGALLDEYEKAIHELETVVADLSPEELIKIVDPETNDPECRSVQTILTHVVRAGYNYAVAIRKSLGESLAYYQSSPCNSAGEYQHELRKMFLFNEQLFRDYPTIKLEEFDADKKIVTRWGQQYDVEQLMEHAIVHVLRHRRQIERFLILLNTHNR